MVVQEGAVAGAFHSEVPPGAVVAMADHQGARWAVSLSQVVPLEAAAEDWASWCHPQPAQGTTGTHWLRHGEEVEEAGAWENRDRHLLK